MSGQPAPLVPPSPGPQRTAFSRNNLRSNPIGYRAPRPVLPSSHEDQSICHSAAEAAESLPLDHAVFPTMFTPPSFSDDLSASESRILPMLSAMVAKVHLLTSEVALLKASAPPRPVPAAPPTDLLVTAALQDLYSKVTSLAAQPPPVPRAPTVSVPPPTPSAKKKPILILSHQGNLMVLSADFPILVSGLSYGSPETYARDNNDSCEADIFFTTVNPTDGEASKISKKERFPVPISQYFVPGPPPGYTIAPSSLPPKSDSWAQVASLSQRAGKRATAAEVSSASASRDSELDKPAPPLPTAQRRFYAPCLHPASFLTP